MKRLEDMTEPELTKLMQACARRLQDCFAIFGVAKPKFALLVFNDPKIAQYICNCLRADMIQALREAADRLERRDDVERG